MANPTLTFACNVCGSSCSLPVEELQREGGTCIACGSTSRHRAVLSTLSSELFGERLAIEEFPVRRDLRGVGLTDAEVAAATGLPIGTVKSRIFRALESLRAALAAEARGASVQPAHGTGEGMP